MPSTTPKTLHEIEAWAFSASAPEPVQDWDYLLAYSPDEEMLQLFVRLAANMECPKARYFCDLLYRVFEIACRKGTFAFAAQRPFFRRAVDYARGIPNRDVCEWRRRATTLLMKPETFDESAWYSDRYSSENENEGSS